MPERKGFSLPVARRVRLRWVVLSVIGHALLAWLLVLAYGGWIAPAPSRTLSFLLDIAPAAPPPPVVRDAPPPPARRHARPLAVPRGNEQRRRSAPEPAVIGEPGGDAEAGRPGGVPAGRPGGRGAAGLRPQFVDRRLWVRPVFVPGAETERPLDMDSVVRRRLLAIADSLERNPVADPTRPPRWTFERNGRLYGIDERGIHLGVITIPTAVLALVPFPQGNIDQARMNQRIMELRAEIMRAAARAEAEDDFRRAVQDIRRRVDREREERRARERQQGQDRPIP